MLVSLTRRSITCFRSSPTPNLIQSSTHQHTHIDLRPRPRPNTTTTTSSPCMLTRRSINRFRSNSPLLTRLLSLSLLPHPNLIQSSTRLHTHRSASSCRPRPRPPPRATSSPCMLSVAPSISLSDPSLISPLVSPSPNTPPLPTRFARSVPLLHTTLTPSSSSSLTSSSLCLFFTFRIIFSFSSSEISILSGFRLASVVSSGL